MKRISLSCKLILVAGVLLGTGWQSVMADTTLLPSVRHQGDVTWLSGGVGEDESKAIMQAIPGYPLVIEFLGKTQYGNEYLANIPIRIEDSHGKIILNTLSDGPFLLAKLPTGRYTASATYSGETEHRTFNLTQEGNVREVFQWKMDNKE